MRYQDIRPIGHQMYVKEDPQQTMTAGGIHLTEILPNAAVVGFYTGIVLRAGVDALEDLNPLASDGNIIGKRVCHRQYLADVMKFEKDEGQVVFILNSKDVEGVVDDGTKVDAI